jgi:hypothetical protein
MNTLKQKKKKKKKSSTRFRLKNDVDKCCNLGNNISVCKAKNVVSDRYCRNEKIANYWNERIMKKAEGFYRN